MPVLLVAAGGLQSRRHPHRADGAEQRDGGISTRQVDGFAMSMPWPLQPVLEGSAVVIASGSDGDARHVPIRAQHLRRQAGDV